MNSETVQTNGNRLLLFSLANYQPIYLFVWIRKTHLSGRIWTKLIDWIMTYNPPERSTANWIVYVYKEMNINKIINNTNDKKWNMYCRPQWSRHDNKQQKQFCKKMRTLLCHEILARHHTHHTQNSIWYDTIILHGIYIFFILGCEYQRIAWRFCDEYLRTDTCIFITLGSAVYCGWWVNICKHGCGLRAVRYICL